MGTNQIFYTEFDQWPSVSKQDSLNFDSLFLNSNNNNINHIDTPKLSDVVQNR